MVTDSKFECSLKKQKIINKKLCEAMLNLTDSLATLTNYFLHLKLNLEDLEKGLCFLQKFAETEIKDNQKDSPNEQDKE